MQLRVREWGEYLHMASSARRVRRDGALRDRDPGDYSRLDWLYADTDQ